MVTADDNGAWNVQIRKTAQTYEPMEITQEEFAANLERDRHKRVTH